MDLPPIQDKTVEIELYKIQHDINLKFLTIKRVLLAHGVVTEEEFTDTYAQVELELQKTQDAIEALELIQSGGLERLVDAGILPRNKGDESASVPHSPSKQD